jgi:hypothetical protein
MTSSTDTHRVPVSVAGMAGNGATPSGAPEDVASLRHLLARLAAVEERVRRLVARRREGDPEPDDPVRGLYISEAQVDQLLATPTPRPGTVDLLGGPASHDSYASAQSRLSRLQRGFGLHDLDVEILLIALAPDLDPRFERLYGYLHDDVTRRRAGIGLVFELLGLEPAGAGARCRVGATSPLVAGGLVEVIDRDRPFLTRGLQVPDRVTLHLLGDDTPTPQVAALLVDIPVVPVSESVQVARAVEADVPVVYVRESARTAGVAAAVAGMHHTGYGSLVVDLARIGDSDNARYLLADAVREATLCGSGLVAGPIDDLVAADRQVLNGLHHARIPVVLVGRRAWDPAWSDDLRRSARGPAAERRAARPPRPAGQPRGPGCRTSCFRPR